MPSVRIHPVPEMSTRRFPWG